MEKDYHAVLGVPKTASQEEIKKAFRELARTCHPDTTTDVKKKAEFEEQFKLINEAYGALTNGGSGGNTDQQLDDYFPTDNSLTNYLIMRKFMKEVLRQAEKEMNDIHLKISISKREAEKGTKKVISFYRHGLFFPRARKKFKVVIPPIAEDCIIKIIGQGHRYFLNSPQGDVFLRITIRESSWFSNFFRKGGLLWSIGKKSI